MQARSWVWQLNSTVKQCSNHSISSSPRLTYLRSHHTSQPSQSLRPRIALPEKGDTELLEATDQHTAGIRVMDSKMFLVCFFFSQCSSSSNFFLILLLQEKLLLTQKHFCLTQLHKAVYPVAVYGSGFGPFSPLPARNIHSNWARRGENGQNVWLG